MVEGKWISDVTAATPVAEAAGRVLEARLQVVDRYLELARKEADKDPEYVHQLRVGTRRAGAAVEVFALCLPRKNYKKARRQLRCLRRAAGAARDWDVFLITLAGRPRRRARKSPAAFFLQGYAVGQRIAAQVSLEEAGQNFPSGFESFQKEILAALRGSSGPSVPRTLWDLARPMLLGLVKELDQAAARNLNDYQHLHQVRIIGKRLRYAMEIFAGCFDHPFRDTFYPGVEEMQEILGRANDSHVACLRLGELRAKLQAAGPAEWKRFRPEVEELKGYHQRRLPQERRRFLRCWQRWKESGMEKEFTGLLEKTWRPSTSMRPTARSPAPSIPT